MLICKSCGNDFMEASFTRIIVLSTFLCLSILLLSLFGYFIGKMFGNIYAALGFFLGAMIGLALTLLGAHKFSKSLHKTPARSE